MGIIVVLKNQVGDMMKIVRNNLIGLKNGSRLRKNYVDCFYNKFFLELVIFFYKNNLIIGYVFLTKYRLRIYYKYYNNKGYFDNLMIPSKKFKNVSYKKLIYMNKRNANIINNMLIILLTSKGFFTLTDFLNLGYQMGGIILFTIYL